MAEAIRITPPQPADQVQLTLTLAEAYALRVVLANVGGIPSTTARGYADRIKEALDNAGISPDDVNDGPCITGSVYFTPGSLEWVEKQRPVSQEVLDVGTCGYVTFRRPGVQVCPTGMSVSINGDEPA